MSEDNKLSTNTKEHYAAIEQEFATSQSATSDQIAEAARSKLFELLPEAQATIYQLLLNGDKEDNVRFNACKLIFEYTIGKPGPSNVKDGDLDKIIRTLMEPVNSHND